MRFYDRGGDLVPSRPRSRSRIWGILVLLVLPLGGVPPKREIMGPRPGTHIAARKPVLAHLLHVACVRLCVGLIGAQLCRPLRTTTTLPLTLEVTLEVTL